jgi:hypothetical protein
MIGVTSWFGAMQPTQGWIWRRRAAATAVENQKPGAEFRPGSIREFQFPE